MDCIKRQSLIKGHRLSRNPNSSTDMTSLSPNNSTILSTKNKVKLKSSIKRMLSSKSLLNCCSPPTEPIKRNSNQFLFSQNSTLNDKFHINNEKEIIHPIVSFPKISKQTNRNSNSTNPDLTHRKFKSPNNFKQLKYNLKFDNSVFSSFDISTTVHQNNIGVSNSCENIFTSKVNTVEHSVVRLTKKTEKEMPINKGKKVICFHNGFLERKKNDQSTSSKLRGDVLVNKDILKCEFLLGIKNNLSERERSSSSRNNYNLPLFQESFSPKINNRLIYWKQKLSTIDEEKKKITENTSSADLNNKIKNTHYYQSFRKETPIKPQKQKNVLNINNLNNNEYKASISRSQIVSEIKRNSEEKMIDVKGINSSFTLTSRTESFKNSKDFLNSFKNEQYQYLFQYIATKRDEIIKNKKNKVSTLVRAYQENHKSALFKQIENYYGSKGTSSFYKNIYYKDFEEFPYEIKTNVDRDCSTRGAIGEMLIHEYLKIDGDTASEFIFHQKSSFFDNFNAKFPRLSTIKGTKTGFSTYYPSFQTSSQRENLLFTQKIINQDYQIDNYKMLGTIGTNKDNNRHPSMCLLKRKKTKNIMSLTVLKHKNFFKWRKNKNDFKNRLSLITSHFLNSDRSSKVPSLNFSKFHNKGMNYLMRKSNITTSQEIMQILSSSKSFFDALTNLIKLNQNELFIDVFSKNKFELGIDQTDEQGNTLLIHAAKGNVYEVVQFLLNNGANPNIQNVIFYHIYNNLIIKCLEIMQHCSSLCLFSQKL